MSFRYFDNPSAFAYMAKNGQSCHFCGAADNCLDGEHLSGQETINAVCFTCMQAGRLMDLDVSANEINESDLDPKIGDLDQITNEITYCTPSVPTWQDSCWPIKNGRPYRFVKIASRVDYESKEQFLGSFLENVDDPEWLWDMLPDHEIRNIKEGQYDISFYLFEFEGDKLTTWDAN